MKARRKIHIGKSRLILHAHPLALLSTFISTPPSPLPHLNNYLSFQPSIHIQPLLIHFLLTLPVFHYLPPIDLLLLLLLLLHIRDHLLHLLTGDFLPQGHSSLKSPGLYGGKEGGRGGEGEKVRER